MSKFSISKFTIALLFGVLLASAFTKISYGCVSPAGYVGCATFDKAVMHPGDLFSNRQDSLIHFSESLVIGAVTGYAILSVYGSVRKKN